MNTILFLFLLAWICGVVNAAPTRVQNRVLSGGYSERRGHSNAERWEHKNSIQCRRNIKQTDLDTVSRGGRRLVRRKRYTLQGSAWSKRNITYDITLYPDESNLKKTIVDYITLRAFKTWSNVANLRFLRVTNQTPDIELRFERGDHGDDMPFDGPGGYLAHPFFPNQGGDVHFDTEEDWTYGTHKGTNLFIVAAHEIGHSLGLKHSQVKGSLMYSYYGGYQPNFRLHSDDIEAIRQLYGKKPDIILHDDPQSVTVKPRRSKIDKTTRKRPSVTEQTTSTVSSKASTTTMTPTTADEVETTASSTVRITTIKTTPKWKRIEIKTTPKWRRREIRTTPKWKRTEIRTTPKWKRLDRGTTARTILTTARETTTAFSTSSASSTVTNTGRTTSVSASIADSITVATTPSPTVRNWAQVDPVVPTGRVLPQPPPVCRLSKLDAAIYLEAHRRTYFFSGGEYWRLDDYKSEDGYPRSMWEWGLPANLDAAFTSPYDPNVSYFFKGNYYGKYVLDKKQPGYPKRINKDGFLGLTRGMDAAFSWSYDNNIYFIHGRKYLRLDCPSRRKRDLESCKAVATSSLRLSDDWPERVDAAVTYRDVTYLFRGLQYWRLRSNAHEVKGGYPRSTLDYWMGCNTVGRIRQAPKL